jgi:hypothetical protein
MQLDTYTRNECHAVLRAHLTTLESSPRVGARLAVSLRKTTREGNACRGGFA